MRKRIAVIGGGVAGLSAAWLLNRDHDVTLFEKNSYIGGHTNTIEVDSPHGPLSIDTGFVVFNRRNYPHLTRLFAHLGIAGQDAEMSFSASIDGGQLEYAGSNLNTLFAQRGNLVNPPFLGMLRDILRFNRDAKVSLRTGNADQLSLGEYLERGGYGWRLCDHYLLPMAAAIWSCPTDTMRRFPALSFLKFFENHGLLDLTHRPQWQTVKGGSHQYVKRMLQDLGESALSNTPAVVVRRSDNGVEVDCGDDEQNHFDEVVFGCHADEALRMIHQPSAEEQRILGSFGYQENRAYLHTDIALMPRSRRVWSAWNYLTRSENRRTQNVSVSYWMNRLQRLNADRDYIVSLNPLHDPDNSKVIAEMVYHHPVFDEQAVLAQKLLPTIQGRDRLWFCGSYAGYGFHEDALRSTVTMLERMGEPVPWLQTQPGHTVKIPSRLQPNTVTA